MNWTECTLQMLYAYHQRTKVQSLILRQNNHEYKNFGTFQLWVNVIKESTMCNNTMCMGRYVMHNVTRVTPVCKYYVHPIIAGGAHWYLQVTGTWLDIRTNQTYDLLDCDKTDQGMVCLLRTGRTNPCFTDGKGLCEWRHEPLREILHEVVPHKLCISTVHAHPQLTYVPYSGCLSDIYLWHWGNDNSHFPAKTSRIAESIV